MTPTSSWTCVKDFMIHATVGSLLMSTWHEAVPRYQASKNPRNSVFPIALPGLLCYCTTETLFLRRANLSGLGKNWVELCFVTEVAYPRQCFFYHSKLTKVWLFSPATSTSPATQHYLSPGLLALSSFTYRCCPHHHLSSVFLPPKVGGTFSHDSLVTEKAFKMFVVYLLTKRCCLSHGNRYAYRISSQAFNTIVFHAQLQCLSYTTLLMKAPAH